MSRPRLLDLYCKAGGAGMGYWLAGFDVVGVDIEAQPRYPFEFIQADALTFPLDGYDVIHASPPCQAYTAMGPIARLTAKTVREYPDLVAPTRRRLEESGVPYVMENVKGAPLINYITLCGSSFGLPLRRHRLFESNLLLMGVPCAHNALPKVHRSADSRARSILTRFVPVYGGTRFANDGPLRKRAMGINWMTRKEITQAIPPAYTQFIGEQLIRALDFGSTVVA